MMDNGWIMKLSNTDFFFRIVLNCGTFTSAIADVSHLCLCHVTINHLKIVTSLKKEKELTEPTGNYKQYFDEAEYTCRDLDYSGYHKNRIHLLFYLHCFMENYTKTIV